MLDSLGVVDKDGDGMRELPNGKKLRLRIDLQADATDEFKHKDNQLVRDWKNIGVNTFLHPVPPDSFGDYWADGTYMIHSDWEASGPVNSLLTNAAWMVPIEPSRWAPLEGQMYAVRGTPAEHQELDVDPYKRKPPRMAPEKGGAVERLWKLLDASKVEADSVKRNKLFFQMCKIMIDEGPFFMGTVANYPAVEVIKNGLMNVPRREDLYLGGATNPWGHPTPAVYDLGTFFWDEPSKHNL
jgi:peptide/nickel transport system substrate-binding protein